MNCDCLTDRARKVMQLANVEANRCGSPYLGTEYILLCLAKEDSGVAAKALINMKIADKIRYKIEALQAESSLPGIVKLPFTPQVKTAIESAIAEAKSLNHNYVGTEHLLLSLFHENSGMAYDILVSLGVSLAAVRQEVMRLLGTLVDTVVAKTEVHSVVFYALRGAIIDGARLIYVATDVHLQYTADLAGMAKWVVDTKKLPLKPSEAFGSLDGVWLIEDATLPPGSFRFETKEQPCQPTTSL